VCGAFTSPVKGQAIITRLKGSIAPAAGAAAPFDLIHFQVLRPNAAGGWTVVVSSEDDYHLPVGGDPDQVNTWTSSFLCVEPGDVIAFADSGGYDPNGYPQGVPYQVFGNVPDAATNTFTGEHKDNNGDTLSATALPGQELLLQAVIGSGPDARPACGGTSKYPNPGAYPSPDTSGGSGSGGDPVTTPAPVTPKGVATVPAQKLRVRKNLLKVRVACSSAGPCQDTLLLTYKRSKVASKSFALAAGRSGTSTLTLTKYGRALLKRNKGKSTVKLDAGGPTTHLVMRRA
jgi:hypothetical protein